MTRPRLYTVERRVTFRMEARLADGLKSCADEEGIPLNTLMQRELANYLKLRRSAGESLSTSRPRESDAGSSCASSLPVSSSPGLPDGASPREAFSEPTVHSDKEGI